MQWTVWRCVVVVAVIAFIANRAGGQSTRPAPSLWSQTVHELGQSLHESDPAGVASVLGEGVAVRSLDGSAADAVRLLAATRRGAVVAEQAYGQLPKTLASDLAEQVKAAEMPEGLKQQFSLRDEAHAKRANTTAAEWLTSAVGAKSGDPVGVLVFCCPAGTAGEAPEVVFVLIRGESLASGKTRVRAIAFGSPAK